MTKNTKKIHRVSYYKSEHDNGNAIPQIHYYNEEAYLWKIITRFYYITTVDWERGETQRGQLYTFRYRRQIKSVTTFLFAIIVFFEKKER